MLHPIHFIKKQLNCTFVFIFVDEQTASVETPHYVYLLFEKKPSLSLAKYFDGSV